VTEIDVTCLPGNLPEFIEVDMGKLEVGHSIHVNELTLPAGVELVAHVKQENPAVAAITLPKGMKSDEAAAETPAAPAA
jgi:large subunit ribosomal protein L25